MSALTPIPQDCVTQGDITPAMRQWMMGVLTDAVGFDNAISYIESTRSPQNILVDGECQIAQGSVGAPVALSAAPQFGNVDMWAAWASGGIVVAGTITQSTASTSTGVAAAVTGLTLTGAGQISFRQRVESLRARDLENQTASVSCVVKHGIATAIPVVIVIRKANAPDNFGATTVIATSSAQSAAASAATTIVFEDVAMGDCSNGIELEVQLQTGPCAGSFVQFADAQLVRGATAPTFIPTPFDIAFQQVQRHYQKSFPYPTTPAQNAGNAGMVAYRAQVAAATAGWISHVFLQRMRATPVVTFFNPAAANAKWRNYGLGADSGAASVADASDCGFDAQNPQVAGDRVGDAIGIHWTADARL